jgi:Protein of unknown function, DUF547
MVRRLAAALAAFLIGAPALAFDHAHKAWDDILHQHVKVAAGGNASRVDYSGMMKDHAQLKAVLDDYAKVTRAEFDGWTKAQQQAFLINDYNALTVEKILTRYPGIKSIRDFGTVFGNPWKDKFFRLFGEPATLDTIEHEILRKPGLYDEPRVHFAVVCASIGCPMLRNEAFTADKLEAFYEDGMKRFLSDRTRNRYDPVSHALQVSMIFKWYGGDFEKGNKGFTSLKQAMARFADELADKPEDRAVVREQKADITFLDYDWSLNDAR